MHSEFVCLREGFFQKKIVKPFDVKFPVIIRGTITP